MKLKISQLIQFANALELMSPGMNRQQKEALQIGEKPPATLRVKGNLNHPLLAWRVGRARLAIAGDVDHLQRRQNEQLVATRIAPPKVEGEPMPPEDQWPSDGRKFQEAMKTIMDEEVDIGDVKPLTWDILKKAGIVGGTPAMENEIEFDGSLVAALGDFLAGEPPDDLG